VFSDFSAQHKLNWFGTVRGRVGYTTGPALFYATGGWAYGEVERSGSIAGRTVGLITNTTFNTFAGTYNKTSVKSGWTIGAGGEMKITDKLTAKAEYLYMDLGHTSDTFAVVYTTGLTGTSGTHTFTSDFTEHVFRVGMNYKLGER
jgi:outer membrane immunogenic protein